MCRTDDVEGTVALVPTGDKNAFVFDNTAELFRKRELPLALLSHRKKAVVPKCSEPRRFGEWQFIPLGLRARGRAQREGFGHIGRSSGPACQDAKDCWHSAARV